MTTLPTSLEGSGSPVRSATRGWLAVVSVMAGIFVIVTAEILPIGLLTPIAAAFRVSDGVAGLTMTLPGIVAAAAAPLVTVTTSRLDRRLMLGIFMVVLAVSNLMCALAAAFWMVLAARVLVGIVIGGFWSIGAGLAGRLVAERHVPRATSIVFSAVPLGSVLGVPAGTFVGDVVGWRAAFVALGALTVAVLSALALTVPRLPADPQVTDLRVLRSLLHRRGVQVGLGATFLVVLAHFGTYTYITPLLVGVTHLDLGSISTVLLVYGAAGIAGNFLAGSTIRRRLRATWAVAATMIGVATLLLPILGATIGGAVGLLIVWGLAYGAVPVCSQTWIARESASPEAATVLFTSAFQATISIGALSGGVVLDRSSVATVMAGGGITALLAVVLLAVSSTVSRAARR